MRATPCASEASYLRKSGKAIELKKFGSDVRVRPLRVQTQSGAGGKESKDKICGAMFTVKI